MGPGEFYAGQASQNAVLLQAGTLWLSVFNVGGVPKAEQLVWLVGGRK
jgi:hypothetical protein